VGHPADARRATLRLTNPTLVRDRCYVRGKWVDEGGPCTPVTNPATGETIATVPSLGIPRIQDAVAAAEAAISAWAGRPIRERVTMLHRWSALIRANLDDLAYLVTMEQGKPLSAAMEEVAAAASLVQQFADAAKRVDAGRVPPPRSDRRRLILMRPVGVCALITSWHYPSAMIARLAAAPLAAGCAVVVKPALQTPLSALAHAALAEEAGAPPGILNVVTGPAGAIAREFATNAAVRKLTFGGGCEIGERLLRTCHSAVEKIALRRAGAAVVVLDDANVDQAVRDALHSTFRNIGLRVPTNRVLVQRGIYTAFASKYLAAVRALRVGPGIEPDSQIGPLIDTAVLQSVERQIAAACSRGATVAAGGRRHTRGGLFFEPTVLYHATPRIPVCPTESSGVIASLVPFNTDADATTILNRCAVAPVSYLFTRDVGRVYRMAEGLRTGVLGVNAAVLPGQDGFFDGPRQSVSDLEGDDEVNAFLEIQNICFAATS